MKGKLFEELPGVPVRRCECNQLECAALNNHGRDCDQYAGYALDGRPLCTACARFRRLPTLGSKEELCK